MRESENVNRNRVAAVAAVSPPPAAGLAMAQTDVTTARNTGVNTGSSGAPLTSAAIGGSTCP